MCARSETSPPPRPDTWTRGHLREFFAHIKHKICLFGQGSFSSQQRRDFGKIAVDILEENPKDSS